MLFQDISVSSQCYNFFQYLQRIYFIYIEKLEVNAILRNNFIMLSALTDLEYKNVWLLQNMQ